MRRYIAAGILTLAFAFPASGAMIDWDALVPGWDDTDASGSQSFANVDGSGIGIEVQYTSNMFDNNSVPNLYTPANSPSKEIIGTLRFTNDRTGPLDPTSITIIFSDDVFIDAVSAVSLSTIFGRSENLVVEAMDAFGNLVAATHYGTNTPGLVALDGDGDASYRSLGLGAQESGLYGDTTYAWTDQAIRSITFSNFVTDINGDELVLGFSSQGIGDITFRAVPEPTTALLLGIGLLSVTAYGRRRD
jgi:hypothetical protein